jgi:3-oxoacyl-[acyl-carrier protein] reductase
MDPFVDLTGKTVLVTGGARGIGEAIVRMLAARGAKIILNFATSRDRADRIAGELGAANCRSIQADLADWRQIRALWHESLAWNGRIDVLVNNAGIRHAASFAETPMEEWDRYWAEAFRVNLLAAAHLSRLAVQHYQESGGGIIIGITGRIAVRGDRPDFFHDGAAKGGMNSLMRGLARFYAKDNILTYLVCAGIIATEQARGFIDAYGLEAALSEIPLGELGQPEDVANIVAFLASGRARYATGATIDVVGASFLH